MGGALEAHYRPCAARQQRRNQLALEVVFYWLYNLIF
jgi:hypothetical protein